MIRAPPWRSVFRSLPVYRPSATKQANQHLSYNHFGLYKFCRLNLSSTSTSNSGVTPPSTPNALYNAVFPKPIQSKPQPLQTGFTQLGVHDSVIRGLEATDKFAPTYVQRHAIPVILARPLRHVLIASETGSGKTLAYLIPLISKLKSLEGQSQPSATSHKMKAIFDDSLCIGSKAMTPLILILQPTRELVDQVVKVAKELSHITKFRVRGICGGLHRSVNEHIYANGSGVDILVATPGAVVRLMNMKKLSLAGVQYVVFDEADELLQVHHQQSNRKKSQYEKNRSQFSEQLSPILLSLGNRENQSVQHIYVAATVPSRMEQWLHERHHLHKQRLELVRGKRLHAATSISPSVQSLHLDTGPNGQVKTSFIRISGTSVNADTDQEYLTSEEVKQRKVVEILSMGVKRDDAGKVLIFCDDEDRRQDLMNYLSHHLKSESVVCLSSQVDSTERHKAWNLFKSNQVRIAICARSFARGIDDQHIRTVIMMDVPLTGVEYLHRVGRIRTGGRVYVLVNSNESPRAEALFLAHVKGQRIANITPASAWQDYTSAGKDRISTERAVRRARKMNLARWIDERASKIGTFRGKTGRGVNRIANFESNVGTVSPKESFRGVVMGKRTVKKKKKKRY